MEYVRQVQSGHKPKKDKVNSKNEILTQEKKRATDKELVPVVIDFLLRLAVHDERDRFVEFEKGAAIQGREPLALDREGDGRKNNPGHWCRDQQQQSKLHDAAGLAGEGAPHNPVDRLQFFRLAAKCMVVNA